MQVFVIKKDKSNTKVLVIFIHFKLISQQSKNVSDNLLFI